MAQAYPGGVGGGAEEGDIDEGGVVDGVVAHVEGFDALLPPVLPVKLAALPRQGAACRQYGQQPHYDEEQADEYYGCPGYSFHGWVLFAIMVSMMAMVSMRSAVSAEVVLHSLPAGLQAAKAKTVVAARMVATDLREEACRRE